MYTGICYDLSFQFMELGIQNFMWNTPLFQHTTQQFGNVNGNRTNQNRLSLCMGLFNLIYNSTVFFFLSHVNRIIQVNSSYWSVCRNHNNVHTINITELFFLGKCGTCHTRLFIVLIEEVLESDGSQGLTFPFYLNMFFCLNRLMQTIRITSSRHDTSGKLINDHNLIIFYYIVLITEHQIISTECQVHIVLNLQILCICQILNIEELLYFFYTLLCQSNDFIFFINDKVTSLSDLFSHNSCHLGHFSTGFTFLKLTCQNICNLIQSGRLTALTGNNQRCSGFIDQYRVHLVNDGIMKISLYQLLFINYHVVTKVIKSQFVVGDIGNITGVLFPTLIVVHIIQYHTYGQTEEFMDFSHPFCISLCQIVIDGNDVHALSFQCIQISRKCRNKGLTFTGSHLCDTSLVKNDTTDDLYTVVFQSNGTLCTLTDSGICFRKQVIQCLSICQSVLIFLRLCAKLFVSQSLHGRTKCFYFINQRHDSLKLTVAVCTKHFFNKIHSYSPKSFCITCRVYNRLHILPIILTLFLFLHNKIFYKVFFF